jgi:hypothetical protein
MIDGNRPPVRQMQDERPKRLRIIEVAEFRLVNCGRAVLRFAMTPATTPCLALNSAPVSNIEDELDGLARHRIPLCRGDRLRIHRGKGFTWHGGEIPMKERMKVFTYVSGTGATVIETTLEDNINEWLESVDGQLLHVTQSESERQGAAHLTVCVWYILNETSSNF